MKPNISISKDQLKGIKSGRAVLATNHAKKSEIDEVSEITPELQQQFVKLAATAENLDGVGMAATQIGILKRFFVGKLESGDYQVILNPKYESLPGSERETQYEGCLSVPVSKVPVSRWKRIKATWQVPAPGPDASGLIDVTEELEGFRARVFQHETDHCDGVTILESGNLNRKIKRDIEKALNKLK